MDYNNVALGLTAGVVGLRAFSRDQLVFYREASSGLNGCAPPPRPGCLLLGRSVQWHHRCCAPSFVRATFIMQKGYRKPFEVIITS